MTRKQIIDENLELRCALVDARELLNKAEKTIQAMVRERKQTLQEIQDLKDVIRFASNLEADRKYRSMSEQRKHWNAQQVFMKINSDANDKQTT